MDVVVELQIEEARSEPRGKLPYGNYRLLLQFATSSKLCWDDQYIHLISSPHVLLPFIHQILINIIALHIIHLFTWTLGPLPRLELAGTSRVLSLEHASVNRSYCDHDGL